MLEGRDQKTLSDIRKVSKSANTDFKSQIEEDNQKNSYNVSKAFKDAFAYIAFWGTIVFGLFSLYLLCRIGILIHVHSTNLQADPAKTATFISHAWSFVSGAIAAVSILSSIKKN